MPESLSHHGPDGLAAAAEAGGSPVPLDLVREDGLDTALARAGAAARSLAAAHEFKAQEGRALVIPGPQGVERVLFGLGAAGGPMALRSLPGKLPAGDYRLEAVPEGLDAELAALAWAFGRYVFDRYRSDRAKADPRPRLVVGDVPALNAARRIAHACALARDMINTPANDLGPRQIETIAREIAGAHGATVAVTEGEALREGYPAVAAVGRGAGPGREPRMVEIAWDGGGVEAPLVALVGKGVTFDTGGLDIKPSSAMRLMKKDMGGAAHALALARMVMGAELPVRLVVLLPLAENAVSGDAMRPGDVIGSRKGLTIEVGNTDAEGRLILADALARAAELRPDLTIDLATLTGAARVALGPDLPACFTDDEALAAELADASRAVADPTWRLPLWAPYAEALGSEIADLANDPAAWAQAGAVTAGLFLKRFAPESGAWLHVDVFSWNARARPGWPVGGEAQAIRALFALMRKRYGDAS